MCLCFSMIFQNLGSDRIWRKINFFIVLLLRNPLFPDMDAFFKKSVENEESTENLQKTHKNQYYLMKNKRKNNKYHRKPSQKRRKKQKSANDINKKQWKTTNNVCFYMIFKNLGSDRIWRKIKFFIGFFIKKLFISWHGCVFQEIRREQSIHRKPAENT